MSRKLYITDDMGMDDELVEIAETRPDVVMLWPWLIPHFDDWGRAEANARKIKVKAFPLFPHITPEFIAEALEIFVQKNLLHFYEVDGKRYMFIPAKKWFAYQTHIRASKREHDTSRYPAPPHEDMGSDSQASRDNAQLRGDSRDSAQNRASPSPSPSPSPSLSFTPQAECASNGFAADAAEKTTEEESRGGETTSLPLPGNSSPEPIPPVAAPPPSRGTRLPQDWQPDESLLAWARQKFPRVDLTRATERFCRYWHSKAGKDGVKLDWRQTWQNWIDRADEDMGRASPPSPGGAMPSQSPSGPTKPRYREVKVYAEALEA